jgi:2-polyprenyl-6-methoxyphenol hydroxylase-like FAD-dependent oxidoreductase
MDRRSTGRVTLLGDAAWCVSPFAGYGSSLAVGGADLLSDALDTTPHDIPAALAAWDQQLRPTVEHEQRQDVAIASIPRGDRAGYGAAPRVLIRAHPLGRCLLAKTGRPMTALLYAELSESDIPATARAWPSSTSATR